MPYEFVQPVPESEGADGIDEDSSELINSKIIDVIIAVDRSAAPYKDSDGRERYHCVFCHVGNAEHEKQIKHTRECPVISARFLMEWGNVLNDQQEWEDSVVKGGLDSELVGQD